MSTTAQIYAQREGGAPAARTGFTQLVSLTMAGGATVSGAVSLPAGAWLDAIRLETPAAFTGSPTNINVRCGSAAAGQQVVADVDAKAQGHIAATLVSSLDAVGGVPTILYLQAAAVGGTSPAGTVNVLVHYRPPVV